jgi:uncharacterized protein
MIVYSKNKEAFLEDVRLNRIDLEILRAFEDRFTRKPSPAEIASWRNSLQFMSHQMLEAAIPLDAGVAIEFTIPLTSKRVDFIITGTDEQNRDSAVIVELKQWSEVEVTDQDAVVRSFVGGAVRDITHPSYQAWTYAKLIYDYNETVREENIQITACAYCHNLRDRSAVNDPRYNHHLAKAPVFISEDAERLSLFIQKFIKHGDKRQLMHRIENGRIRPSKNLADLLKGLLAKQSELVLVDEQKVAYEMCLQVSDQSTDQKHVVIVEGGPGTGKSVVALNLLAELTSQGLLTQYVSKNAAPRSVFAQILRGSKTKSEIDNLFRGSGAFTETEPDFFDILIVDEAHRLNEKSGLYSNLGENQVKEIINSAKTSIFFLDEDQRIAINDIGSKDEILKWARVLNAKVAHAELPSQFRCDGSDGYLAFLDDTLGVRETANKNISAEEYDFRVYDNPVQLWDEIRTLNRIRNRARLVAGYCWLWKSKKDADAFDITFPKYGFEAKWNLDKDGSLWIIAPDSVDEVGCIHTCQGLELDYVGVFLGPDFLVREGEIITDGFAHPGADKTLRGFRTRHKENPQQAEELADRLIKNTYRTLMTRGMKGCFIYSEDVETRQYFAAKIREERQPQATVVPFQLFDANEQKTGDRWIPVYDLKVAAGAFSEGQIPEMLGYTELPEFVSYQNDMFIAQVVGESMNKRIPNGSWCLFRRNPGGTRNGKIVLAAHRDFQDPDTGDAVTVKRYESEKSELEGQHNQRVLLKPESTYSTYKAIVLENEQAEKFAIIAEFLTAL